MSNIHRSSLSYMLPQVLSHLSSLNMMNPALPRHLLGIADPESIEDCVQYGIDTFDSWSPIFLFDSFSRSLVDFVSSASPSQFFSYPTRVARHGLIMAENGNTILVDLLFLSMFF